VEAQLKDPKSPFGVWKSDDQGEESARGMCWSTGTLRFMICTIYTFSRSSRRGRGKRWWVLELFGRGAADMESAAAEGCEDAAFDCECGEGEMGKYLSPWEARAYLVE